ncbi:cytochrome c oxidase assembly factor 6 homolog [Hermetia illucens]|uniref:cytochrome c oxidase assembly factor 6 homolog n=1 Tax=Hermetia illucens TaxID=343691 RepID=UPI0018CC1B8B|nr:cytochrome c oxidase assembly factor 6 homolog [Hermetia illucens]
MSFPNKSDRERCWSARDEYWRCLDQHNVTDDKVPDQCKELRKLFEKNCPSQWVKHFDRKRLYEQFQAKMNQGYDPLRDQK